MPVWSTWFAVLLSVNIHFTKVLSYQRSQCTGETLSLHCPDKEKESVIHARQVLYGQSESCQYDPHRCVLQDPGWHPCTGSKSCDWTVPIHSIPGCGISNYVELTYDCIPASVLHDVCNSTRVLAESGYITSPGYPLRLTTLHEPCYLDIVLPQEVQHIYIYLLDLDIGNSTSKSRLPCHGELIIREQLPQGHIQQYFCSQDQFQRNQLIFTSNTNSLQISFHGIHSSGHHRGFLIYYIGGMGGKAVPLILPPFPLRSVLPVHSGHKFSYNSTILPPFLIPATPALSQAQRQNFFSYENFADLETQTNEPDVLDWWDIPEEPEQHDLNNSVYSAQQQESTGLLDTLPTPGPWAPVVGGVMAGLSFIILIVIILVMVLEKRSKPDHISPEYDEIVNGSHTCSVNQYETLDEEGSITSHPVYCNTGIGKMFNGEKKICFIGNLTPPTEEELSEVSSGSNAPVSESVQVHQPRPLVKSASAGPEHKVKLATELNGRGSLYQNMTLGGVALPKSASQPTLSSVEAPPLPEPRISVPKAPGEAFLQQASITAPHLRFNTNNESTYIEILPEGESSEGHEISTKSTVVPSSGADETSQVKKVEPPPRKPRNKDKSAAKPNLPSSGNEVKKLNIGKQIATEVVEKKSHEESALYQNMSSTQKLGKTNESKTHPDLETADGATVSIGKVLQDNEILSKTTKAENDSKKSKANVQQITQRSVKQDVSKMNSDTEDGKVSTKQKNSKSASNNYENIPDLLAVNIKPQHDRDKLCKGDRIQASEKVQTLQAGKPCTGKKAQTGMGSDLHGICERSMSMPFLLSKNKEVNILQKKDHTYSNVNCDMVVMEENDLYENYSSKRTEEHNSSNHGNQTSS